ETRSGCGRRLARHQEKCCADMRLGGVINLGDRIDDARKHDAGVAVAELRVDAVQLLLQSRHSRSGAIDGPGQRREIDSAHAILQNGLSAGWRSSSSISSSRKQRLIEKPAISIEVA